MAAPTARPRARHQAEDLVAQDRLRFLTAEPLDPRHVRGPILASWQRSRDLDVAADRIQQDYTPEIDLDTPLTRSAQPVLRTCAVQLDDQPMSIILTDPTGLVLTRQSGDRELDRCLDRVQLAPGFRYAEENVGTNGIGTALEVGGPAYVFGHEHYAEDLEGLSCAGVPIRDPIAGRTVGAIDLTCWAKDAGPLLLTLAKNTAEQIRQALLAGAGAQQLELLQEYLRTCRRLPGIVFAVAGDTVILNDQARRALDPADQTALLAHAGESLTSDRRRSVHVELPSGAAAQMYCHPVGDGPRDGCRRPRQAGPDPPARAQLPRPRRPGCPCRAWSARTRCGCAPADRSRPPRARASGWWSPASRGSASWPWSRRSSCGASRSGTSRSSTPRTPAPPRAGSGRSGTPWPHLTTASSSGTSTPSTGSGSASSSPPWAARGGPLTAARPGSPSP